MSIDTRLVGGFPRTDRPRLTRQARPSPQDGWVAIPDTPGLGSAWAERYEPDGATAAVHAAAHEQFTGAFAALRPLRLGRRRP